MNEFEIEIVTYLDRTSPVAEIYYQSHQWAEVSQKASLFLIKIYPHPKQEKWEFAYANILKVIELAKNKLLTKINTGTCVFTQSIQNPQQINEQAENVLKEIISHPQKKEVFYRSGRLGKTIDIYTPNTGGARYSLEGDFIGFLDTQEMFRIIIATLPDRENPVAEVAYENVQWAEISKETCEIILQLYPHPNQKYWEFQLDEVIEVLQKAKEKLLN